MKKKVDDKFVKGKFVYYRNNIMILN